MEFCVGRITYGLRKSQEPLPGYTELVDHDTMTMLLSCDVDSPEQLPAVARMFAYAWLTNAPPVVLTEHSGDAQREALADYIGTVCTSFARDLAEQGGERAIVALTCGDKPRKYQVRPIGNEGIRTCGHCGGPVAPGSVINDPPGYHAAQGRTASARGFVCPHCDRVTTWQEGCTEQGALTGDTIEGPILLDKPGGMAWIRNHPTATNDIYV